MASFWLRAEISRDMRFLWKAGVPIFSVREDGKLYAIAASDAPNGHFSLEAHLTQTGAMTLAINGKIVARGQASGPIRLQPKDGLSIGEDTLSAVGDYTPPYPLRGKVDNVTVSDK